MKTKNDVYIVKVNKLPGYQVQMLVGYYENILDHYSYRTLGAQRYNWCTSWGTVRVSLVGYELKLCVNNLWYERIPEHRLMFLLFTKNDGPWRLKEAGYR